MPYNSSIGGNSVVPFTGGGQVPNPANVLIRTSAPPAAVAGQPSSDAVGTIWINVSTGNAYQLVQNTLAAGAVFTLLGGATGAIATINTQAPVAGNYTLAGTANQITKTDTAGTTTFSLPAAITAPGSIAATTTVTATLGNITATAGNFVASAAGSGIVIPAAAVGPGASPQISNARAGSVTFSSVSIAANAVQTLTITNSTITGSSTVVLYTLRGATTGSSLTIQSVTNSAGSSAVTIMNGAGLTTTTANITLDYLVLN